MKRIFDLTLASSAMLLLSPVIVLVGASVRCFHGSPVLFRQARPGRNGETFELVKFRTMTSERDESGQLLPDAERLTVLGRLLRRTSLDELPTLWNVVRGDMSLVGPRPLLVKYLPRYSTRQARRHEVSPGITGWAQVNGRNAISWEERLELDVWYVEHQSFLLDLKILLLSVWTVAAGRGVSHEGSATMPEFQGAGRDETSREDEMG